MRSCRTRLQQQFRSSYFQPEQKYFTVRLLLSMTLLLSRRWSTAFLCTSNDCFFHTNICHTFHLDRHFKNHRRCLSSFDSDKEEAQQSGQPMLLAEGLFAVDKPLDWTSSDVVSYIRGILEKDARARGFKVDKVGSKQRRFAKKNTVKCGHGGTLDPLATGVLVIGVGQGTKMLEE
jgi:TruB family pseudouridylate synthase (N terminal domain)